MKFMWFIFISIMCYKHWLCLKLKKAIRNTKQNVVDKVNLNIINKPEYSKWIYSELEEDLIRNVKDNEMVSGADLAQIHTQIGKYLPMNLVFHAKALNYLKNGANKDYQGLR